MREKDGKSIRNPRFLRSHKERGTERVASFLVHNHYYSKISTNLCICFHDIRYLTEIIELLQAEVEIAMKDLQV